MKSLKILSILALAIVTGSSAYSQEKKETFKVSGECGMCKNKIEKAAKTAGASFASWNTETKVLTVKYKSTESNSAKIKQSIAGAGYDTPGYKATNEAYNKLHECCKYERDGNDPACCDLEKCGQAENCCKEMDCCKDGKCTMMSEAKHDAKAACCQDGKCSKEGHSGKDCCKKS
jgi:periplasmic mercuric ion binding protein